MDNFSKKINLIENSKDIWVPPVYLNNTKSVWNQLKSSFYSFFDFQYSTIYRDLTRKLPHVTGNVLDAGCGLQPYRNLFSSKVRYAGIDVVESKDDFGYQTLDAHYYSGDVWPVKSGTINFILCTETLEHVAKPDIFFKEAFRTLKPGGEILLTVPFEARWHFVPHDYWRYTPTGLDFLLTKAGFVNNRVYARGNLLTVVCYKIMALIYSVLHPQKSNFVFESSSRLIGVLFIPVFLLFAIIGNLTKFKDGTTDCLGYTVLARRPSTRKKRYKPSR
jgi:SAM-dependent methyltransferase